MCRREAGTLSVQEIRLEPLEPPGSYRDAPAGEQEHDGLRCLRCTVCRRQQRQYDAVEGEALAELDSAVVVVEERRQDE